MKKKSLLLLIPAAALLLAFAGPRVELNTSLKPIDLPWDLDVYLATSEAQLPDLVPGTEKTIIWAGRPGQQTELAVVSLHGFSASRQETAPLADRVAAALGANLFYTRFRGHGRSGDALAEASVNDWLNDAWEAYQIGRRLGQRVLLIGTSNGGSAASWLAAQPGMEDLFGLVLISPNFGPRDPLSQVLTWPWAGVLTKMLVGDEYGFTPSSEAHARYWTHRYPSRALLPMMGMVKLARTADLSKITQPLLILYSPDDQVVNPKQIGAAFARFGSRPKMLLAVEESSDAKHHVLAGEILAPEDTQRLSAWILSFVQSLDGRETSVNCQLRDQPRPGQMAFAERDLPVGVARRVVRRCGVAPDRAAHGRAPDPRAASPRAAATARGCAPRAPHHRVGRDPACSAARGATEAHTRAAAKPRVLSGSDNRHDT